MDFRFATAHLVKWHMDTFGCKFNRIAILQKAGSFLGSLFIVFVGTQADIDCTDRLVQVCTVPTLGLRPSSAKHRCNSAGLFGVR